MTNPSRTSRRDSAAPRARGLLLVALATLMIPAALAGAAEEPKKIVFFGNSFTIGNGSNGSIPTIVRNVAVAAGKPAPTVFAQANGGWKLDNHISQVNADDANLATGSVIRRSLPAGQTWDYAVLQEYSTKPTTHSTDGNAADFRADAATLFGQVRSHSPAAEAVLFETWARGPGHTFYTGGSPQFPGGPAQMQAQLRSNYSLARDDLITIFGTGSAAVAPVGDGFEYGNFANLYNADIYHANNRGSLLAGLVLYSTIYGDDVSDVNLDTVAAGLGLTSADGQALASWSDAVTQVPEPTQLGVVGLLLVTSLARRRRRARH